MALSHDAPAPYAPASALLNLLEKNRSTGLPEPVTKENLVRLGVPESLAPRTLQSLCILDLVDEGGAHTNTLKSLRLSPEPEYKGKMAEWLNAAYSELFPFVDPSKGDEVSVRDAFRPYGPKSMADRMVKLFIDLYAEAGVWPENAQRTRSVKPKRRSPRAPIAENDKKNISPSSAQAPKTGVSADQISKEKALEYRLVDLMSEATDDDDVMGAIITIITFLKTRKPTRFIEHQVSDQ